jgi:hypothetical protein
MSKPTAVVTFDPTMKRGRGRPPKALVEARTEYLKKFQKPQRTDSQVLDETHRKFALLRDLAQAAAEKKDVKLAIVTGAPGIGKTYNIVKALKASGTKFEIVNGSMSAPNLYATAWQLRERGNVMVIDDGDSIFDNEESLNLLKAMTDSNQERHVNYRKESPVLAEVGADKSFIFRGSIIVLSNKDFDQMIASGNKIAPHLAAIQSRAIYIDLAIHTQHEIMLYINDIVKDGKIWRQYDVPKEVGEFIVQFLTEHKDRARDLSLRTIAVCCDMYHIFGADKYKNALYTKLR